MKLGAIIVCFLMKLGAMIVLNQDFHKIYKIVKIFYHPVNFVNLVKILVQDNSSDKNISVNLETA